MAKVRLFSSWLGLSSEWVRGADVVVVDVLRATSTIAIAVERGATVMPVTTPALALRHARTLGGRAILAGERQAERLPGFTLDNSPAAVRNFAIGGKTLVLTTTNGTQAIHACRGAARILAGALVNADALAEALPTGGNDLVFVCAGRSSGAPALEDFLGAGAILAALRRRRSLGQLMDGPRIALELFRAHRGHLQKALRDSDGGRLLLERGARRDIAVAAQLNSVQSAPQWVRGRFVRSK